LGSFSVRHRRARQGRNPKTGELIEVPAKRVPFFTVGHELRQRVNGGRSDGDPGETPTASQPSSARVADLGQVEAGPESSDRESAAS
jgi:hypothetical protein